MKQILTIDVSDLVEAYDKYLACFPSGDPDKTPVYSKDQINAICRQIILKCLEITFDTEI